MCSSELRAPTVSKDEQIFVKTRLALHSVLFLHHCSPLLRVAHCNSPLLTTSTLCQFSKVLFLSFREVRLRKGINSDRLCAFIAVQYATGQCPHTNANACDQHTHIQRLQDRQADRHRLRPGGSEAIRRMFQLFPQNFRREPDRRRKDRPDFTSSIRKLHVQRGCRALPTLVHRQLEEQHA